MSTRFNSSGVNGDDRDSIVTTLVNVSSSDRNKAKDPSSDDCEIPLDEIRNVIGIDLLNFEIPHTRYAIDRTNNTFYISEKIAEGEYNFFGLKASTGGYTIGNLAVSLELSTLSPTPFTSGTALINSYNFVTAGSFGKVGVISSGDVEYNIHVCQETLSVVTFTKVSDTEASVKFISPYEYILAPGALLTFKIYSKQDREIQVTATTAPRTVTVIGDFAGIIDSDVTTVSYMVPYSSRTCVAEVSGFGLIDLEIAKDTMFEVLAMGSPFSAEPVDGSLTPMVLVNFPPFLSSDDYCMLIDSMSFLDGAILRVGTTFDDTHFQLDVDGGLLWEGATLTVAPSDNTVQYGVTAIALTSSSLNTVIVTVTPDAPTGFIVGDIILIDGFLTDDLVDVEFVVSELDLLTDAFSFTFSFPTDMLVKGQSGSTIQTSIEAMDGFDEGTTYLAPVNQLTGIRTTYVSPHRFDLSRGRRVIICRATIDDQDIGTMFLPKDRTRFFARIQLFSGADLVNFLGPDNAVGTHRFNSIVKRLHSIRMRFYNEDSTLYEFVGVEYTAFLRITSLDSNTGL